VEGSDTGEHAAQKARLYGGGTLGGLSQQSKCVVGGKCVEARHLTRTQGGPCGKGAAEGREAPSKDS